MQYSTNPAFWETTPSSFLLEIEENLLMSVAPFCNPEVKYLRDEMEVRVAVSEIDLTAFNFES